MHRELSCLPLGLRRVGKPSSKGYAVRIDDVMVLDDFQHFQNIGYGGDLQHFDRRNLRDRLHHSQDSMPRFSAPGFN